PESRNAASTSTFTRSRYAFSLSRIIARSSGPICIQRSAFLRKLCRSSGGIAIHRSRKLFELGHRRGGGSLRWLPPGGCASAEDPHRITIAPVAIALTMFEYRRPTSCSRRRPTIRPDRRQRRSLADRSQQLRPVDFPPNCATPADASPQWQRSLPRPRRSPEPISSDSTNCAIFQGASDALEFFERRRARKKQIPRPAASGRGDPIIAGRPRVSFVSRIEQIPPAKVAPAMRPTTSYTSG